jgi:predicted RNase H-like nuclease (RuvC/YqgF family)
VLHQDGKAVSLELALELIAKGDAEVSTVLTRANGPTFEEAVIARLEALTRAVEAQTDRIKALEAENAAMYGKLKALTPPSDTQPGDKAAYVAEMEQIHTDKELEEERMRVKELNRRIEYLQGELERRDSQAQQVKRPWWRRWLG